MKLLFINNFFYPDQSATSQLLSELAFSLAAAGHDVTVVCGRGSYTDPSCRHPRTEVVHGVRIERVGTPVFGRRSLPGRAIDVLLFYVLCLPRLFRLTDGDTLLIAKTDPPLIGMVAGFVRRLKGARQINWLQDLFPESAVALHLPPFNGRFGRLLTKWRNRSLRLADCNVVISERMKQTLLDEGLEATKLQVIPNWANGERIRPAAAGDNPLRAQWGLADSFVVMYSGNLGRVHDVDTLLAAAIALRDEPDIRFLFVGGGVGMERLREASEQHALQNCRFEPYRPLEQLSASLGIADVHIVSLRPELTGAVMPSKYYGIAAAGRACIYIGNADGETPKLLARSQSGLAVDTGASERLAGMIRHLRDTQAHVDMGRRARTLFETELDFPIALRRWRALLDELTPPSN